MPQLRLRLIVVTTTLVVAYIPSVAPQPHGGHGTGGFDSGELTQGTSWEHVFDTEADIRYVCHPHPFMKGHIVIRDDAPLSGMIDVRIANYSFQPAELVIQPGTTVRWTNEDNTTHTATQETTGASSGGLFGLLWWQVALLGVALAAGLLLIFARPRRK